MQECIPCVKHVQQKNSYIVKHQQHTSMYTKITVVFIKCLNARNIGSVFNHLNTTHNLIAMQSKSVTSTKHYWGSTTQAQAHIPTRWRWHIIILFNFTHKEIITQTAKQTVCSLQGLISSRHLGLLHDCVQTSTVKSGSRILRIW